MNFDIVSMKQRAKALFKEQGSTPIVVAILWTILTIADLVIFYNMVIADFVFTGIIVFFFIWLFVSACCKWYSLKVSREEATSVSDFVIVLKEKQFKAIMFILIKSVAFLISMFLAFIGLVIPFYCLRMSEYIIKDEDVNIFQAMIKSFSLLKGHFGELIKLDISNLGWLAFYIFTGGLAGVCTHTYMGILYAEFYDYLKAQSEL